MSGTPLLLAQGLAVARGRRPVLSGVDLTLQPGEVVGLMGCNGAGKSSLLACLLGLLPPAGGRLEVLGQPLPGARRALFAEVGAAFQEPSLDGELSARENLCIGARLFGVPARLAAARADALLAEANLAPRAHDRAKALSGGMRRRLELVRALAHRPRLLLLDEAAGGLDPGALADFWALLRRLASGGGVGVLAATHLPDEAARCDRLLVLDGGRVVADAPPGALIDQIGGDVVALTTEDPAALAAEIERTMGLGAWVQGGRVMVLDRRAHQLVPRLVEALGASRLAAVEVRRPGLGDVFFRLTGRDVAGGPQAAA